MFIRAFYERTSATLTYVLHEGRGGAAIVIDPVWDQGPEGLAGPALQELITFLHQEDLDLRLILDTHPHADHITGAQALKGIYSRATYAIGEGVVAVQRHFATRLPFNPHFRADGSQFDRLLRHGELLRVGSMDLRVLATPGHTPACLSYLIDGSLFTGDALFMPDFGTGRCDFPAGSAETLYQSITNVIYGLDASTEIFVGHDYMPNGRPLAFRSTIAEEREHNIHIRTATTCDEFVRFRSTRDASLSPPKMMLPSLLANLAGGDWRQLNDDARHILAPAAS